LSDERVLESAAVGALAALGCLFALRMPQAARGKTAI
jgi:hypothetical protein